MNDPDRMEKMSDSRYRSYPQNYSEPRRRWDSPSFIVGLIIGIIITMIIMWIMYASRIFIFALCPARRAICTRDDYITDPGDAIAHGEDPSDILYVNSNNELYYRRVRSTRGCVPLARNTLVKISYPQYCEFETSTGSTYEGRSIVTGTYVYTDENGNPQYITAGESCSPTIPNDKDIVTGTPLPKWDSTL